MKNMCKKVVSIVEDNELFQRALVDVISSNPQFVLGRVYGSAEVAMDMKRHPPDIAIVDINLPGKSGIELIAHLQSANSQIQCLVCSMHDDDDHIVQALENGAVGYILKDASVQQISNALDELLKGGAPMSPYIASRVISFFRKPPIKEDALLSGREREVLRLLAQGLQYKEIAEHLFLSVETVKKHMKNIYQKLHVQNKVEAINKYRQL
jgi:DNA-binding NarL/FixJ family response regulator